MTTLNPGSKHIILASSSPRRKEILESEGFSVTVFNPSEVREISLGSEFNSPEGVVVENSLRKVRSFTKDSSSWVLASDTIVVLQNQQFGKPKDKTEAIDFLKLLGGETHKVYSGFALKKNEKIITGHDVSLVTFKRISKDTINRYISLVNVMDKAGAYAIQEEGDLIIDNLKGSFHNVMGLPLEKILPLISE